MDLISGEEKFGASRVFASYLQTRVRFKKKLFDERAIKSIPLAGGLQDVRMMLAWRAATR
jgi:hypothetical protein